MGRNKKTYTEEFKMKCIGQLLDGKSFSEVCASNSVAPSTLSDWKKAILTNGFGSKELRNARKERDAIKAQLDAARNLIGKKELEIELLKKEQHF